MLSIGLSLKLVSYAHVNKNIRKYLVRIEDFKKKDKNPSELIDLNEIASEVHIF